MMFKVGVVGSLTAAYLGILHPELDIRAICNIREKALQIGLQLLAYQRKELKAVKETSPVKAYTDYDEMLKKEKLDIVIIATPHKYHAPMAVAALQRGCHVVVEKPMCTSYQEIEQMVEAVQKTGLKLVVNQSVRTTNTMHHVIDLREKGKLGTPYYIKANYIHCKDPRLESPKGSSVHEFSPLLSFGSHPIDLVLALMDDEAQEVYTVACKKRTNRNFPFYDAMSVSMKFKGGRIGYSLTTAAARRPGSFEFELYGTKMDVALSQNIYGEAVTIPDLDFDTVPVGMRFYTARDKFEEIRFLDYPEGHKTSFFRVYENLIHAIKHDVKSATMADVIDGARCISVCLAAEESAKSAEPVPVRSWTPLTYHGAAPKLEMRDYMQGYMRLHFLSNRKMEDILDGKLR